MHTLKHISPSLQRELLTKWYLPRSFLSEFGHNHKGFITIDPKPEHSTNTTPTKGKTNKSEQSNTTPTSITKGKGNTSGNGKNMTLLVDPTMNPPIRVVNRGGAFDREYVQRCLHEAMTYRKSLGAKLDMGSEAAYRLIHETGDGLPGIAIDIYAQFAQIQMYSLFWKPYIKDISSVLLSEFGMKGVYLKHRIKGRPQVSRHFAGEKAVNNKTEVRENGLTFLVHLTDPHSTGLFLDMRRNRKTFHDLIQSEFASKKISVLNTFCHTCSFSVYAAKLSASTTNIDLAEEYLDWGKDNLKANNLTLSSHHFIAQDVISAVQSSTFAPSTKTTPSPSLLPNSYHAVVLDPPSFLHTTHTQSERTGETYAALAARMAALVREGGLLFAFANTREVPRATWVASVEEGLGMKESGKEVKQWVKLCELEQDVDFRHKEGDLYGKYLKGVVLKKIKCS